MIERHFTFTISFCELKFTYKFNFQKKIISLEMETYKTKKYLQSSQIDCLFYMQKTE